MDIESYLPQFGLAQFRPGQREVIDSVMRGRDCLCIMPTGGGKSLCFQLPALARSGTTVVVSPLIALMKDQVDALQRWRIPATFINSSLDYNQRRERTAALERGEYRLVYVAPERLRSQSFVESLKRANVQLLAIDEAHCISQWGHDFRPDYARLGIVRRRLGQPQTMALTATATPLVRADICQVLELDSPATFVSGFARDNLRLQVESATSPSDKDLRLVEFLKQHKGVGIIYAATRKTCEHLVELLQLSVDTPVVYYHAGIEAEKRKKIQDDFMSGQVPLIVSTNAFGMGIDKHDVRFVIHYNLPGSIEAYYQEAGRAGRDGQLADCLLYYSYQDRFIQEFFIDNAYPSPDVVRDVFDYLKSQSTIPIEKTLQDIKDDLDLSISTDGVRMCETLLEKAGAIERLDSQENQASIRIESNLPTLVDLLPREAKVRRMVMRGLENLIGDQRGDRVYFYPRTFAQELGLTWESVNRAIRELVKLEGVDYVPPFRGRAIHLLKPDASFDELSINFAELEARKRSEYEKLDRMVRLAQTRRCRQLEILEYFGDPQRHRCRKCDNCQSLASPNAASSLAKSSLHTDRLWYAILVVLSGAARTHGRIGIQLLAQMLAGSASKKLKPLRLHQLPTFGKLSQLKQVDIDQLVKQLLTQGLLTQVETTRFRPVIQISEFGRQLLNESPDPRIIGEIPAQLARAIAMSLTRIEPLPGGATPAEKSPERQSSQSTNERAGSKKVGDTTVLASSSTSTPSQRSLSAPHFEPSKNFELDEAAHDNREPNESQRPSSDFNAPESQRPSYYWTWRLLHDGYSLVEVQQIRGLDRREIVEQLTAANEHGLTTMQHWVLNRHQQQQLRDFVHTHPTNNREEMIESLPHTIAAHDLVFYLASTASSAEPQSAHSDR